MMRVNTREVSDLSREGNNRNNFHYFAALSPDAVQRLIDYLGAKLLHYSIGEPNSHSHTPVCEIAFAPTYQMQHG
jgi:hypothetical protein